MLSGVGHPKRFGIRRLGLHPLALAALVWPLLVAPACGDNFEGTEDDPRCEGDPNVPCNEDPWGCALGQNCWIDGTATFQCVNKGSAGLGEACQPSSGSSPCEQDMICASTTNDPGTCRRFCDPADPCKTCHEGHNCVAAMYPSAGNAQVYICFPI